MSTVPECRQNACVVVLGDIGRSPRMQYHAESLIENNYNVDIIGYADTEPSDVIRTTRSVHIHQLSPFPDINLPSLLKYVLKTIWQIFGLLKSLLHVRRPKFLLIQNPPAVPTLAVCYLYCLLMHSKMIIDWHNYTHSILALNTSPSSLIVRLALFIEKFFGRRSYANLCVTKAMQVDLQQNWGIRATTLYDRPARQFHPITNSEKHDVLMKLSKIYPESLSGTSTESGVMETTVFTQKLKDNRIIFNNNRPGIIVSSTSWTPDEDFSVLLNALEEYEFEANKESKYPRLICIITGKGPQKEFYLEKIKQMNWNYVKIITPWLEAEDYPKVLAASDIGVCLHWSSSGLDLPMKVVDMFGCGLPVCAINFKCLNELVIDGKNGFVFENFNELADLLKKWFLNFPNNIDLTTTKEVFGKYLHQFQCNRWQENWNTHVGVKQITIVGTL